MFCELPLDLVSELGGGFFSEFGLPGVWVAWFGSVGWHGLVCRVVAGTVCWCLLVLGWFGNLVCGALVFGWWLCSGLSGDCWLRCN